MPKKIDDALKARAVRLINDHLGDFSFRASPTRADWTPRGAIGNESGRSLGRRHPTNRKSACVAVLQSLNATVPQSSSFAWQPTRTADLCSSTGECIIGEHMANARVTVWTYPADLSPTVVTSTMVAVLDPMH
jgi:hypothetical protein